ncbi:hypothetical protein [Pacificibacter marinus]|uniref:hypothetical protein n=1 Tax=Pacificibacter marinus TaxID=658057 RepID=UPI001C0750F2|nr:hypothetical protein [Pacificibacter marinus]MBU2866600.1 hypothetical protein [Pacificibacter marinus]
MIDVTRDDDFWIVTLNRSEKADALTAGMLRTLFMIDLRDTAKVSHNPGIKGLISQ